MGREEDKKVKCAMYMYKVSMIDIIMMTCILSESRLCEFFLIRYWMFLYFYTSYCASFWAVLKLLGKCFILGGMLLRFVGWNWSSAQTRTVHSLL